MRSGSSAAGGPAATGAPNGAGGDSVRVAVLDATLALLARSGIAAFDIDQVDDEAGLPAGTCRAHYRSHGQLFAALLERTAGLYDAELRASCRAHPHDMVDGIVAWLLHVVGPARERSRVVWSLLLDAGTRAQVSLYADALQARWDREMAVNFGLSPAQVRVAWALVEGWIGRSLIHDLPNPDPETLAVYVRVLLRAHDR